MECALPLAAAWLLRRRADVQRHHQRQQQPQEAEEQRSLSAVEERGSQSEAGEELGGESSTATSASALAVAPLRTRRRSTAEGVAECQRLLVHLFIVQVAVRSGLWHCAFDFAHRIVLRGAHRLSKRTVQAVVRPMIRWARPRAMRIAPPAAAAAAQDAPPPSAAEVGVAAASDASPQSTSDTEDRDAVRTRTRPPNIVIISRPRLAGTPEPDYSPVAAAAGSKRTAAEAVGTPRQRSLDAGASVAVAASPEPASAERESESEGEGEGEADGEGSSAWDSGRGSALVAAAAAAAAASEQPPCSSSTSRGNLEIEADGEPTSDEDGGQRRKRRRRQQTQQPFGDSANLAYVAPLLAAEAAAEAAAAGTAAVAAEAAATAGTSEASSSSRPAPPSYAAAEHEGSVSDALSHAQQQLGKAAGFSGYSTLSEKQSAAPVAAAASSSIPVKSSASMGVASSNSQPGAPSASAVSAAAATASTHAAVAAPPRDPALEAVVHRVLGLPLCVGVEVLSKLDTDAKRVLRAVSRGLYFEASRHITHLTVQADNLETLVYMPMHHVFPALATLTLRGAGGSGHTQQQQQQAAEQQQLDGGAAAVAGPLSPALLTRLFSECLPHLHALREVDASESCIHTSAPLWDAFARGLAAATAGRAVLVRLREPTSWWARGATAGLPGDPRDGRDHFPPLLEALRVLQRVAPRAVVDLQGITVRKHTATRVPQLCGLQSLRRLTLFGKSAIALPHGHRLASHLGCFAPMQRLRSLELLSYEDVSDSELAVLAGCASLRHLYVDSLFIKMAAGPVFPSITSLTAARIKFILQPLTTIFPSLTKLRLGVLHSELNKKINSASMSCLAGCSEALTELVVCPVLWKGQWQVLPTLPGLRRLSLVHCRDLSHLREVLKVVGRSPSLEVLELQACSSFVAPWPGVVALGPGGAAFNAPALPALPAAAAAAGFPAAAAAAVLDLLQGDVVAAAAAAAADAAGADASGSDTQALGPLSEGSNLFSGLSACRTLRTLVVHDCAPVLVRHLTAANLPDLAELHLEKLGATLRLPDLQAAVLNLPGLTRLQLHDCGSLTAAQAQEMPAALSRPSLVVDWRSCCKRPSLYTTRGFGTPDDDERELELEEEEGGR